MTAETSADWCEATPGLIICGTHTHEHSRRSEGVRWCFHHRTRHEFWRVVYVPTGMSYYGPHAQIEGPSEDCMDLFPGWSRDES